MCLVFQSAETTVYQEVVTVTSNLQPNYPISSTKAKSLHNLRIEGSSSSPPLALKYLEVRDCFHLISMEIDHAANLTHLVHTSWWAGVRVENCESLVEVTTSFVYNELPALFFNCLEAYAGQMESLSPELDPYYLDLPNMVELSSLEQLKIQVTGRSPDYSILDLVPLINASPRLHTLRVEVLI
ncbi:hypothetical protein LINPERHAP2_LOCUS35121 [Linum perenne]